MDLTIPIHVVNSSWEFGWDALVAIGTLVASLVALAVGLLPAFLEKHSRHRRANYLSIVLSTELETALLPVRSVEQATIQLGDGELKLPQFQRCQFELRKAQLPILGRLIGQLECFDQGTASVLATAYSASTRVFLAIPNPSRNELIRTMDSTDDVPAAVVANLMTPLRTCLEAAAVALQKYSGPGIDPRMDEAVGILVQEIHSARP